MVRRRTGGLAGLRRGAGLRRLAVALPLTAACLAALIIGPATSASAADLAGPAWLVSDTAPGAAGVSYSYTFTTATTSALDSVTMTVPPGTAGIPVAGVVSPPAVAAGGSVSMAGLGLTYTFAPSVVNAGTRVSIEIGGLTNTTAPGAYSSVISTSDAGTAADSGTTPEVTLAGSLTLAPPASLAWAATDTGHTQDVVDTLPADQQLTVDDSAGTGAGWHITVSATTFTSGAHTLPDTGALSVTGSTSALTSAAPSVACAGPCVLPTDTTSYPVTIDTAASSPSPVTVYDAAAGSGTGTVTVGGSDMAHPLGWWALVPAAAYAGSYTSTVTLDLVSGP